MCVRERRRSCSSKEAGVKRALTVLDHPLTVGQRACILIVGEECTGFRNACNPPLGPTGMGGVSLMTVLEDCRMPVGVQKEKEKQHGSVGDRTGVNVKDRIHSFEQIRVHGRRPDVVPRFCPAAGREEFLQSLHNLCEEMHTPGRQSPRAPMEHTSPNVSTRHWALNTKAFLLQSLKDLSKWRLQEISLFLSYFQHHREKWSASKRGARNEPVCRKVSIAFES